jgi:hypothetical protein
MAIEMQTKDQYFNNIASDLTSRIFLYNHNFPLKANNDQVVKLLRGIIITEAEYISSRFSRGALAFYDNIFELRQNHFETFRIYTIKATAVLSRFAIDDYEYCLSYSIVHDDNEIDLFKFLDPLHGRLVFEI